MRHRFRIANSLGRHPVLAIRAVQITAQHAEAECQSPGTGVEERFLLDGIALHPGDVTPGNVQPATPVEAHLADAGKPFRDRTAVAAGIATDAVPIQRSPKLTFANVIRQDFGQVRYAFCPSQPGTLNFSTGEFRLRRGSRRLSSGSGNGDTWIHAITCSNWTSSGEGSARVGYHDRQGRRPEPNLLALPRTAHAVVAKPICREPTATGTSTASPRTELDACDTTI